MILIPTLQQVLQRHILMILQVDQEDQEVLVLQEDLSYLLHQKVL